MPGTSLLIETWPLDRIKPYGRNARKIPQSAINKVAASLQEFGWRQPLVVEPNGDIVVGHVRRLGALKLGWTEAPVHVAHDLSPAQLKAYRLMDNRSHDEATWDETLLGAEFLEIRGLGDFDLLLTGFDLPEITELLAATSADTGKTDEDDAPALRPDPISQTGDVWVMPALSADSAPHRLMCADSTQQPDVARLCAGRAADLVWSDPPYGVTVASRIGTIGISSAEARSLGTNQIQNDSMNFTELTDFLRRAFRQMLDASKPGACWYIAAPSAPPMGLAFSITLQEINVWRNSLVWVKDSLVMGRMDYHYRHEPIYFGWTPGAAHQRVPTRDQDTVWECPRPKRSSEHPTMKPVALIEKAVLNSSVAGQLVLDLFGGSGSTMIACEKTARVCYTMEIDPRYVDVIVIRWQEFSGREAVLDGDGRTFAQVRSDRIVTAEASEHPQDHHGASQPDPEEHVGVHFENSLTQSMPPGAR